MELLTFFKKNVLTISKRIPFNLYSYVNINDLKKFYNAFISYWYSFDNKIKKHNIKSYLKNNLEENIFIFFIKYIIIFFIFIMFGLNIITYFI